MSTALRSLRSLRTRTLKKSHTCVVGILITPHQAKTKQGTSHMMKAYVDWFEDRGVHVVPIPYDTKDVDVIFSMIHGLLIPGGETEYLMRHRTYMRTVRHFVELALHSSVYFPIWGTCFGMEALLSVIGGFSSFSSSVSHGLSPLHLTDQVAKSRMFHRWSKKALHRLESTPSTQQNHEFGLLVDEFKNNHHLTGFYHVLATAIDEAGHEYVAAIEGRDKPVYGVMWHPERQRGVGDRFAEFFVSELRKNRKAVEVYFPSVRTVMEEQPCSHYPELRGEGCYFFRL